MSIKADTKSILADSFCALLKKNAFENITIKDIVNNCEASRATFYRHFIDKYDLITWIYKSHVDELINSYPGISNCKNMLYHNACYYKENPKFFTRLVNIQGQNSFNEFVYTYALNYFEKLIINNTGTYKLPDNVLFSLKLYTAGTVFMGTEWINSGLKESPEKIAQLVYDSIPKPIKDYLK